MRSIEVRNLCCYHHGWSALVKVAVSFVDVTCICSESASIVCCRASLYRCRRSSLYRSIRSCSSVGSDRILSHRNEARLAGVNLFKSYRFAKGEKKRKWNSIYFKHEQFRAFLIPFGDWSFASNSLVFDWSFRCCCCCCCWRRFLFERFFLLELCPFNSSVLLPSTGIFHK